MKRIIIFMLALVSAAAFADVEIIVTASRIEEDSKTTPAYVRVIPEEEIQKESTVLDVLKTIPDISVREVSPAKQSISMGGFGDNGFGRTLILINGRPVNRPDMASFDWNSITLSSVSRIEIVKGSMSSQYGDQAVAGVINIITKQPEGLTANVSASITDILGNNQSAFASYGNETAGLAVGINRVDNNPTRDRSDSTILSTNIDSFYNFKNFKVKAGGYYSNSEYQLPGGISADQFNDDPDVAVNQEDEGLTKSYGINGSASFSLGSLDVIIPVSYSNIISSSDLVSAWWSSAPYSDSILNTLNTSVNGSSKLYEGDSIEIIPIGGIDYTQFSMVVDGFSDKDRVVKTVGNELSRADYAAWFRTKINYLDTLIVDGGLRYNHSSLDTNPGVVHNQLVYDAGAAYILSPELNISFRYGRVFRYPFLDEQVSYYSGPVSVNTDLNPEIGNSYTISADFSSDNFNITVAPYLISMDDEIAYDGSTNVNMEATLHYGASVESEYSRGIFNITSGYAYDYAEFSNTGKIIPRVPEHTVYGTLSVSPVKAVKVSTDGRYSSQFYTDEANTDSVPGRFEWNIRADWNINENFIVYLLAKNILADRTPILAYGNTSWYPMPGRTFETGMKWAF